jgi:hypothetical protein
MPELTFKYIWIVLTALVIDYEYYIYCGPTVIRRLSLRSDSSSDTNCCMCFRAVPLLPLRVVSTVVVNPLTPELNSSAQRCLTRFFTGDFGSWTVHLVNICVKDQQMQQLFIQFINYVWYLVHVSALHCHPHGAFLVLSEGCSIEEQSIEYCGWACRV